MEKKQGTICIVNKALFITDDNHPVGFTIPVNTRLIIDAISKYYFRCTLDSGYKTSIELEHDCSLTIITDNKKINKFKQQLAENNQSKDIITDVEFEKPIIKKNKVIRTQTMTIKVDHLEDGGFNVYRTNDGFNSMELLGQIDFMAREIVKQLSGEIKPDVVKRTVIVD